MSTNTGPNEEDYSEVNATPFVEQYEWGLIGFRFYEGWMEDVRVCAAGLKARVVPEREAAGLPTGVNPAERLQKALISFHYDANPPLPDDVAAGSVGRRVRPLWMAPFLAARYAVKRRRLGAFRRFLHGWWLVHEYDRKVS